MFLLRRLPVRITAAIAVMASACLGMSAASAAETITVCGNHSAGASAQSGKRNFQLSRLVAAAQPVNSARNDSFALMRDDGGFDLIVNWHEADEHSLRAAGADILGMELGGLIHLMVPADQGKVEHYLFSLDQDGSGGLMRSGEASLGESDTVRFACSKPR